MPTPQQGPTEARVEERLRALEEGHGFAERLAEQLGEEIRTLGQRVTELNRRLAGLEASIARRDAPPEVDAPK